MSRLDPHNPENRRGLVIVAVVAVLVFMLALHLSGLVGPDAH